MGDSLRFQGLLPLQCRASRPRAGVCVVQPVGDLDIATAPVLAECLRAQTADHPEHLVLDLTAVRFLAAAGVTVIMGLLRGDGGVRAELHLLGVHDNRPVERALRLTGVLPLLRIHGDLDAVLDQLDRS